MYRATRAAKSTFLRLAEGLPNEARSLDRPLVTSAGDWHGHPHNARFPLVNAAHAANVETPIEPQSHAQPATDGLELATPADIGGACSWRGRRDPRRGEALMPHFLVVNDFFADPWEQRRIALARDYRSDRPEDANYGGSDSIERGDWKSTHLTAARSIASIVGAPIRFCPYYRLNSAGTHDAGQSHIHCDEYDAAIIYLSPPDQCVAGAGTHFWRHKRLGWESFDDMRRALPDHDDAQLTEVYWNELGGGKNTDEWERTLTIPMKWNRLLLFRGDLFHSAGHSFGTTKETARLIQVIQFDVVIARAQAA